MKYLQIECEVISHIVGSRDCAHHQQLGWSRTDWHTHNRGQLIYAENGIMRLYVHEQVFYIPSYHAAWIPEGVLHKVVTESVDLTFSTLYLNHKQQQQAFYKEISVFHVPAILRDMIMYTSRWSMFDKPNAQEQSFLQAIKLMLPDIGTHTIDIQIPASTHEQLTKILQQIETQLEELPPVAEIAREAGMSERTMNRLFIRELKMPFSQYLKLLRITTAIALLGRPGANVSEVSAAVGYRSLSSFSNAFNEVMGRRPQFFLRR